MSDEEIGEPQGFLEFAKKIDDLGLNGNIQRGDGFIADDQFGL